VNRSLLSLIADLLRTPTAVLDTPADQHRDLVPQLLGIAVAGAAVFGAVVGAYRGGIQIPYAALKMPLLFLAPVALGLPAVRALFAVDTEAVSWRRLGLAGLVGMARASVLAAAFSPVLWLYYSIGPDYHAAILALAASMALVALPGLMTLAQVLPRAGRRQVLATLGAVGILGVLTAQAGWVLRPFVARPTAELTFLRPVEADVFSSLGASLSAAQGRYRGWEPESRGLLTEGLERAAELEEVSP
jgi:hypothetical protein